MKLDDEQFSFELSALATRQSVDARHALVSHNEQITARLKETERLLAAIAKLSTPVGDDWEQHAYLTLEMVNIMASHNEHTHDWERYNDEPRVYGCACGEHRVPR